MTDQTPGSEKEKEAPAFSHHAESSVLSWLRSSNEKELKDVGAGIYSALIHPAIQVCCACRSTVCFNLLESHVELLISDGKLLSCFGSLSSSKCFLRASFIFFHT